MSLYGVPEVLKQKLVEVEGTSKILDDQKFGGNGRFLLWKGVETGFFYRTAHPSPGSLTIYDYKNGTANTMLLFSHKFGHTALIVDAIYFPLSADDPGIVVAVTDRSMNKNGDYMAVFSLLKHSLLNSFYVDDPITCICSILDGSAERTQFLRLSSSFHKEWPHILLVGCEKGYVTLVSFDLQKEKSILPICCENNLDFQEKMLFDGQNLVLFDGQNFVFRADDGTTKPFTEDLASVSALHWEEKCGLVFVGYKFGGVMAVSLRTFKAYELFYIDGTVLHFASQEPEEDPRPILFLWIAFSSLRTGTSLLLCKINFPKDEERKKLSPDGAEHYTYLEPQFMRCMKWPLYNCSRLYTMRTIQMQKGIASGGGDSDPFPGEASTSTELGHKTKVVDTSLLFVAWSEQQHGQMRIKGSLFDLNAFYAKRLILIPKIQPDSTIARQFPFISRFSARELASTHQPLLDIMPNAVYRFSAPALLNESIDQLCYPSTFHLKNTTLTSTRIFQTEVQPIQVQLINELSQNFVSYFENPKQCVGWIHAIGLANSAPSANNEERACLLRVSVHNFFPGIVSLIETSASNTELLKFIQKWMWKELKITKTKFDELCFPIFANPPHDLSPNSRGYVQHARLFFERASTVFGLIHSAVEQSNNDQDWIRVQAATVLQVRLHSACIAFGLLYQLLPIDPVNIRLYSAVTEQFARRVESRNKSGRKPQIHELIEKIIELNKENELWQGKTAAEWYPPKDFTSLLPILLFVNVSVAAKTELIVNYCRDLETAAATFLNPPNPLRNRKFFALFISFLSEENLVAIDLNYSFALAL